MKGNSVNHNNLVFPTQMVFVFTTNSQPIEVRSKTLHKATRRLEEAGIKNFKFKSYYDPFEYEESICMA